MPPPSSPTLFPTRRSSDLHPNRISASNRRLNPVKGCGDRRGFRDCSGCDLRFRFFSHRKGRGHLGLRMGEERSEEHTSELQSRGHLVCRLLLEKKKHTSQG